MDDNQYELAHWHYTQEEWQQFAEGEWAMERPHLIRPYLIIGAASSVFLIIVTIGSVVSFGWPSALIPLLIFGTFISAGIGMSFVIDYKGKEARYRQLRTVQPQVRIMPDALVFGGQADLQSDVRTALTGLAQSLRVTIEQGNQPFLCFDKIEHAARGKRTKIRLPIPPGHENEAHRIVDYFSWEHRIARKAYSNKG